MRDALGVPHNHEHPGIPVVHHSHPVPHGLFAHPVALRRAHPDDPRVTVTLADALAERDADPYRDTFPAADAFFVTDAAAD